MDVKKSLYEDSAELKVEVDNRPEDPEWEAFIGESTSGTLFHQKRFLSYHAEGKFDFLHLKFRDARTNELIAILPGGIRNNNYYSPIGASYGGFAFKKTELAVAEKVLKAFLTYAKERDFAEVYMTPPTIIYSDHLNQNIDFLLQYYGFAVDKHLISNSVWVHQIKENSFENVATNMHLRCVRKAVKEGLTVELASDDKSYREAYEMLIENKLKFNTTPTHSFAETLHIRDLFPEDIFLFMAKTSGGEAAGSIWAYRTNKNTLLAFYINHYYKFRELRAVNLLYQKLVEFALDHKISWVDLGVSMDTSSTNPMEPSRSLIYFKECIGTRGFLRTTYKLSLK